MSNNLQLVAPAACPLCGATTELVLHQPARHRHRLLNIHCSDCPWERELPTVPDGTPITIVFDDGGGADA